MEIYKAKSKNYSEELNKINNKYNVVSLLRLACILFLLASGYYYIKTSSIVFAVSGMVLFSVFIILMRFHARLVFQKLIKNTLISINENEISFLKRENIPFENGQEFTDFHHPYGYDLDVFGTNSLFQSLNRTATYIGKKTLANQLLTLLPNEDIIKNQEATKELAEKLDWRQEFLALAKLSKDDQSVYASLLGWSKFFGTPLSKWVTLLSYIAPFALGSTFIAYWITSDQLFLSCATFMFLFNLAILGKFLKRIQIEIANAENIDAIIDQYSRLIEKIEKESFKSLKLIALQQQLSYKKETASVHLKELAGLFSKMDSINNFVTAILFNGLFLFNLHVLKSLINWKKDHAEALEQWMEVIGEFEFLSSIANFAYNNPEFAYPELNSDFEIDFTALSHPLLNPQTRVGNDVSFQPQPFMILTGSNMSGKSTFLRSLGINMVLTGIGAPVCAKRANVHALPVLVSMRLSDSLSDSESYFFAEIKRLKQIMDALQQQPAFVLLDEILRGTNSDDKRNGTIEVIKKIIGKNAVGAIATHDIEVCLTTNLYPNVLTNKCFEVEIRQDELHFDYKLNDGVCKNKSATFLMQKMGVI